MKTLTTNHARPSTAPGTRLRRLAVVGLLTPVIALAACSGESPVTADPSVTAAGGTTAATAQPTVSGSTSSPATTASTPAATATTPVAGAVDGPARYSTINAVIKDPHLGHTITAARLARNLAWPGGQPVGKSQFEIVGVRVVFKAGDRYSADLQPSMLSLVAATPAQAVPVTNEFKGRYQAVPLTTATRGKRTSGWVFFKVDRGTATDLKLVFSRPAYKVSTTGKDIVARAFTVQLSK